MRTTGTGTKASVTGDVPELSLLQCHVHAIGHDAFLVQALEAGDTITLGLPWLSEHGELLLTFDVSHLRAAALAVVEAAVTG